MRVGISGAHGTGKTTLAAALCACLPGHAAADEPYYQLEEEGYAFGFPPSVADYRALLARAVRSLAAPPVRPQMIFDRTPLDYLAAAGADPWAEAGAAALRSALGSLDLLVLTPITAETERLLPPAELPRLRARMNDALLDLVYADPLHAWGGHPGAGTDRAARRPAGRGPRRAGPRRPTRPPGLTAQIITQAQCGLLAGRSARRQYPAPRTVSMTVSPSLRRR